MNAQFCSISCSFTAMHARLGHRLHAQLQCVQCGDIVTQRQVSTHFGKNKKGPYKSGPFCSVKCARESWRSSLPQDPPDVVGRTSYGKRIYRYQCTLCEGWFQTSVIPSRQTRRCRLCGLRLAAEEGRTYRKPRRLDRWRECEECGAIFEIQIGRLPSRFCGRACAATHMRSFIAPPTELREIPTYQRQTVKRFLIGGTGLAIADLPEGLIEYARGIYQLRATISAREHRKGTYDKGDNGDRHRRDPDI